MNKEFEVMEFGSYPQEINGEMTPIEWIILDRNSEYRPFMSDGSTVEMYHMDDGSVPMDN